MRISARAGSGGPTGVHPRTSLSRFCACAVLPCLAFLFLLHVLVCGYSGTFRAWECSLSAQ